MQQEKSTSVFMQANFKCNRLIWLSKLKVGAYLQSVKSHYAKCNNYAGHGNRKVLNVYLFFPTVNWQIIRPKDYSRISCAEIIAMNCRQECQTLHNTLSN